MKKERIQARVADLVLNEGQLDWLPKNPRQWTQTDIDRTMRSLERDPDFQEDNPLKAIPLPDGKLLVFAGNLRTVSAGFLNWDTFETIVYYPKTKKDQQTVIRRAMLDNGSFGSWDIDRVANEWQQAAESQGFGLDEWGVPEWVTGGGGMANLPDLSLETVPGAGASGSGYNQLSLVFKSEDYEVVDAWIKEHSKDELITRIIEICQPAEAK